MLDRLGSSSSHLAIDWYYRDLTALTMQERKAVNYDHPDSLEVELFVEDLDRLRSGSDIAAPVYDFATHTRSADIRMIPAADTVITEGILLLALPDALTRYDLSVYIDVPAELRLERRLRRDAAERGRDPDDIIRQWNEFVAPMHDLLVEPSKAHADVIVGADEDLDTVADALATRLTDSVRTSATT